MINQANQHRDVAAFRRAAASVLLAATVPAWASSVVSLGPHSVQTLVAEQLFNQKGRWYLTDDAGACFTYLDSPHARIQADRLVLTAHLFSRLGQRVGNQCAGADFASNVTLSAKLRGAEHALILDDIRIDRVDDESTRNALNIALRLDPQALPKTASIDVFEFMRKQVTAARDLPPHLDQFHILNITTRAAAVVIQFDLTLSAP